MGVTSKRIGIIIGVLFAICAVGGTMAFKSTFAESILNQLTTKAPDYPKNKNGLTYGFAIDAPSVETLPDLIHAGSVDGTAGYLLKKDYLSGCGCTVPLYDVHGKTIIGSYHIGVMDQVYPTNENGQTYGSAADANSLTSHGTPGTEPDLIRAVGVDGTSGYVLKKDLDGELPKKPEEALAIQRSRPPGGRDIPLYDVDGETVIGVFHIVGD